MMRSLPELLEVGFSPGIGVVTLAVTVEERLIHARVTGPRWLPLLLTPQA